MDERNGLEQMEGEFVGLDVSGRKVMKIRKSPFERSKKNSCCFPSVNFAQLSSRRTHPHSLMSFNERDSEWERVGIGEWRWGAKW